VPPAVWSATARVVIGARSVLAGVAALDHTLGRESAQRPQRGRRSARLPRTIAEALDHAGDPLHT
jgi:hypothetical protein